jgi:hypothetical protein
MADQTQAQDQLSSEDLAALHEVYGQLHSANDPRADKVRQFIVAQGNSLLHPEDTRGAIEKGWDWLNKGLISKETFVRALSGRTSDELKQETEPSQWDSPAEAAKKAWIRGATSDTAETTSSLTSPVSAGLTAAGGAGSIGKAAQTAGVAGKTLRAAKAAQTAARAVQAVSGAGFGIKGAEDVAQNLPAAVHGDPEAMRATLTGASMAAGGVAGAGDVLAPKVMHAPVTEAPGVAIEGTRNAAQNLVVQPAKTITEAARGYWNPEKASPAQAATMAFRPRNSKYNWKQEIQTALPDMRRAADSAGVDVNKMTIQDAHQAAGLAKRQVWDELTQNFSDPHAAAQVETSKVADTIRSTVTQRMEEQNPNLAERINQIADTYEGRKLSVQDIEERVQDLNNETRAIEARHPADKWAAQNDPNNAFVFAEKQALRNLLDSKMDELAGPGYQALKSRYGALKSVEDVIQRRIPVAERQAPESLSAVLSKAYAAGRVARGVLSANPLDIAEGAVSLASQRRSARLNNPDYLTQQAFSKTQPSPGPAVEGEYMPMEGEHSNIAYPPQFERPQLPTGTRERGAPQEPLVDQVNNREHGDSVTPLGPRGDQGVMVRPKGLLEEPQPVPTRRALPPITLPEKLAPKAPNSVEAVGIPETAEASALQKHFETKPQSFNEFLKQGRAAMEQKAAATEAPKKAAEEAKPSPDTQTKNDFLKAGAEGRQRPFESRAEQQSAESELPGRSSAVRLMNPKELNVDPSRFQWRQIPRNAIPESAPWDQTKAGPIDIWKDPADSKWYVVEGHHRFNHAVRTNTPEVEVRAHDFADAKEAKAFGALRNIELGNASPFDAGLYLRETGMTPEDLQNKGVNLTGDVAQKGAALAKLSNGLWNDYKTGGLDDAKAVAIGSHLSDPSQQQALADLAKKQKLNAAEMGALAKRIQDQGNTSQTSMGLFGSDEKSVSNAIERERVALKIEKELSTDRTALQSVLRSGQKRSELIRQAGNIVNVDKTSEQAMIAAAVKEGFNRLRNRSGEVADLLDEAGQRRTAGEKSDAIFKELYPKISSAVLKELGGPDSPGNAAGNEGAGGSASGRQEAQEGLDLDRGNPEAAKTIQKAIRKFGTTEDHREAGWVLPNGRMLDFSGRAQGSSEYGVRYMDHREVGDVFPEGITGTQAMIAFEKLGALRFSMSQDGDVNVSLVKGIEPTLAQVRQLRAAVASGRGQKGLYVDLYEPNADDRAGSRYIDNARPSDVDKVLADVKSGMDLDRAPAFYSKALQVAEQKLPNYAPGDAILSTLKNSGVKPEEMKWIGLDDYLKSKPKLSKQDVTNFIRENQVDVKEVMKGTSPETMEMVKRRNRLTTEHNNLWRELNKGETFDVMSEVFNALARRESVEPVIKDMAEGATKDKVRRFVETAKQLEQLSPEYNKWLSDPNRDTKFSEYTLPGGENYRELLLTKPPKFTAQNVPQFETWLRDQPWYQSWDSKGRDMNQARSLYDEWKQRAANTDTSDRFRSSHFEEPNILAHVRFNDRVDAQGKKNLFVEEVQSDWHEKGRKEGYKVPPQEATGLESRRRELESIGRDATPEQKQEWADIMNRLQPNNSARVPDAPFKTSWHELALKRMLRYAAENGYDKLSWTTGEQQNARYDLSKEVKSLNYDPDNQRLVATLHNGSRHIDKAPISPGELGGLCWQGCSAKTPRHAEKRCWQSPT